MYVYSFFPRIMTGVNGLKICITVLLVSWFDLIFDCLRLYVYHLIIIIIIIIQILNCLFLYIVGRTR
jgi:hypothetical protein